MLYTMYGEAVKNKETAKYLLDNETPYFNILDVPVEPISIRKGNILIQGIKGFIIGLVLALGIVVGRKWLLDELGD